MSDSIRIIEDQGGMANMIAKPQAGGGDHNLIAAETSRALQEAQAGFIVAKQFPRNEQDAIVRIVRSCQRPTLAEKAQYAFPRGGSQVTGPSIRLAEVLVQHWGNINFGYRELHEAPGMTQVLAYAYDLETNARAEKVFHVKHVRDTRQGPKQITDRRDLYELIANQASRRIRSCILQLIPGDVVEAALEAASAALEKHEGTDIEDRRENVVKAFAEHEVTAAMIEKRMGKKIKALLPQDLVVLRNIYRSLSDGMSSVDQWFPPDAIEKAKEKVSEAKKATEKKTTKKTAEKAPEPEPEPPAPPEGDPEEPEPDDEEGEDQAEELSDDEMLEAITIETKAGRPSNFKKQIDKRMTDGIEALIESGLDEEKAAEVAVRDIYSLMVKRYEVDDVNSLPINSRPAFVAALGEWSEDPGNFSA
jgi:hypothetical protein